MTCDNPGQGKPPVDGSELYTVFCLPWAQDLDDSGVIGYAPSMMDVRTKETRPATLDELIVAAEKIALAIAIMKAPTVQPTVQKVCP